MHKTTWAPNTMLSSRKEPIPRKLPNRRTGRPYSYIRPSGHGQGSYKKIRQLRGVAVYNKNKIQYNSA